MEWFFEETRNDSLSIVGKRVYIIHALALNGQTINWSPVAAGFLPQCIASGVNLYTGLVVGKVDSFLIRVYFRGRMRTFGKHLAYID